MMPKNWPCKQIGAFLWSLAVFALAQVVPPLIAQTATEVVRGTVSDENGKTVANVTVTATRTDSGQKQTTNTGPEGTYKLDLPPGNYRLTFEAAGFKTLEISSATINGTVAEVLDAKLEKGEQVSDKPA